MKYTADRFKEDLRILSQTCGINGGINGGIESRLKFDGGRVAYLTSQGKWENLPKGWTKESVKKFWKSLTGDVKKKVTKCIKQMTGKVDNPAAFCNSISTMVD